MGGRCGTTGVAQEEQREGRRGGLTGDGFKREMMDTHRLGIAAWMREARSMAEWPRELLPARQYDHQRYINAAAEEVATRWILGFLDSIRWGGRRTTDSSRMRYGPCEATDSEASQRRRASSAMTSAWRAQTTGPAQPTAAPLSGVGPYRLACPTQHTRMLSKSMSTATDLGACSMPFDSATQQSEHTQLSVTDRSPSGQSDTTTSRGTVRVTRARAGRGRYGSGTHAYTRVSTLVMYVCARARVQL